jgi:hypothetical protein
LESATKKIVMEPRRIKVELLPHERSAILRANFYVGEEVEGQLNSHASSSKVETIIFSGADVHLLAGDLNHAIVKRGCRHKDIIHLRDRFDYINDQFANNQIPVSRFSNVANNFLGMNPFRAPNDRNGQTAITPGGPQDNLSADTKYRSYRTGSDFKLDHNFSDNHRIFWRFSN